MRRTGLPFKGCHPRPYERHCMGVHGFYVATMRVTGCCVPFNINGLYPLPLTCLSEAFARTGIPFNKIVQALPWSVCKAVPCFWGGFACRWLSASRPKSITTAPSEAFARTGLPQTHNLARQDRSQHGRPLGRPCHTDVGDPFSSRRQF